MSQWLCSPCYRCRWGWDCRKDGDKDPSWISYSRMMMTMIPKKPIQKWFAGNPVAETCSTRDSNLRLIRTSGRLARPCKHREVMWRKLWWRCTLPAVQEHPFPFLLFSSVCKTSQRFREDKLQMRVPNSNVAE